jgi:hypothetical protein
MIVPKVVVDYRIFVYCYFEIKYGAVLSYFGKGMTSFFRNSDIAEN